MAGLFSKAIHVAGFPERFAFQQAANVAQAFGHDAAGMGEISMPIMVRKFSRGWRTILLHLKRKMNQLVVLRN